MKTSQYIHIMKLLNITVAIVLLTIISCNRQTEKNNPYKLKILSTSEEYLNSLNENNDNEFVDLIDWVPGVVLDIRYATSNNFTGQVVYDSPRAFARKPVARALSEIQQELKTKGLGLKVFDAYRPYSATLRFYEVMQGDTNFVAAPWRGSRHNRGCAVDVTLINPENGEELEMPTPFDDFTEKAAIDYMDLPEEAVKNRQLLIEIMTRYGFTTIPNEWWHFDYKNCQDFDLMDVTFEMLDEIRK